MDLVVVPNSDGVGSVTWWSLPDKLVNRDDLEHALFSANLKGLLLPKVPTAEVALQRALMDVFADRNTLVKPTKNGYAILPKGKDSDGNPQFTTTLTVTFAAQRSSHPDLEFPTNWTSDMEDKVRDRYQEHSKSLSNTEMSAFMVAAVRSLSGIGLHDRGRMYFVPSPGIEDWRKYYEVVRQHYPLTVFNLPTMQVSEAVDVLSHNVRREVEDSISALAQDIKAWAKENEDAKANGTQPRKIRSDAMDSREAEINRLLQLTGTYQKLLGANLQQLEQAANDLHSSLMEVYMARM